MARTRPPCTPRRVQFATLDAPMSGVLESVRVGRERTVSRVLFPRTPGGGDHLSRTPVSRRLQRPLPEGLASNLPHRVVRCAPKGNALLFGLAPGGVCLAGRSPGRRWALTPPFHPCRRCRRCHFCGTFLRVTPTGRYPAPCSLEPGLSSPPPRGRSGHPSVSTHLGCYPLAALPVPSSMARLASASAPRFRSRGTWLTTTRGNVRSSPSACRWSGSRSALRTL